MRQRITFIHEPQDAIDPKTFQISNDGEHGPSLTLPKLRAAREDKITFSFDELPEMIQWVLKEANEVHIKHVQPGSSKSLAPFNAQIARGLHASFDAWPKWYTMREKLLSDWLIKEFNLKSSDACGVKNSYSFDDRPVDWHHESFIRDDQKKQTAYYVPTSQLPSKDNLMAPHDRNRWGNLLGESSTLTKGWSQERLDEINEASAIDIDYTFDVNNGPVLTLTAYWTPREWERTTIQELVPYSSTKERIEIGVLSNEPPEHPQEVKLAGYLTLLGTDKTPKPTMFSFPSKHHSHLATYSASFLPPTGLHPNLRLTISSSLPPPLAPSSSPSCALYAHLLLPPTLFPDRHQFTSPLFLASKNLSSLTWISTPIDLEAPAYAPPATLTSLILQLSPPSPPIPQNESWTAEIPLHLRYLPPTTSGYKEVEIPSPMLFWGCEVGAEEMEGRNPFERGGMVVEKLLSGEGKNVFWHLGMEEGEGETGGMGYLRVGVPVLSTAYARYLELGTAVVVALGFGWVVWKAVRVWMGRGYGNGTGRVMGEERKKKE